MENLIRNQTLGGKSQAQRRDGVSDYQLPTTLFVRLPSGNTVPLCLEGGLRATIADLKNLVIHRASKAATAAQKSLILTHKGKLLHNEEARLNECLIKAYDTIQVQIPLPGGSDSEGDLELLKNNPEAYAAKIAARARRSEGGGSGAGGVSGIKGIRFISADMNEDNKEDDRMVELEEDEIGTLGPPYQNNGMTWFTACEQIKKTFKISGGGDWSFYITNSFQNELDLEEEQEANDINLITVIKHFFKEEILNDLDHENVAEFKIAVKPKRIEAYEKFLNDIPVFRDVKRNILKGLTKPQQELMNQYENNTLTDNKQIRNWLVSLSVDQKENLLVKLRKVDIYKVLQFLLTKNEQWTDISDQVHKNSSGFELYPLAGRLINKQSIKFDMDDEADDIIIELLSRQKEIMEALWQDMQPTQKVALFLKIIEDEQAAAIVETFIKSTNAKSKVTLQMYWDSLDKENRLRVWLSLKTETKLKIPFSSYLTNQQSRRLWDNIGQVNRVDLWKKLVTDRKKEFLSSMTTHQQVSLWNSLVIQEQQELFQMLELSDDKSVNKKVQFWRLMSHKARSLALKSLEMDEMKELFKSLTIEDKSILLGMVNEQTADVLKLELSTAQTSELFFYQQFNSREKTPNDKKTFINDIMTKFYEDNNQFVPFSKIEDGYVQCIPDPEVDNGFITVQIVKSVSKTENQAVQSNKDTPEDFYELETDEAHKASLKKSVKNDQFRLVENRYGKLQEQEPSMARNGKVLGIVSFWQYSQELQYWCTHSFYVPNPVVFNNINQDDDDWRDNGVYQNVLYTGRNGDIFFFNEKEVVSDRNVEQGEIHMDLCLQILYKFQNRQNGELSRETQENCITFRIHKNTKLYEYIKKGNLIMEEYNNKLHFLNAMPTIIEENTEKYLIFSTANSKDIGPAIYFYDLQESRTVAKISGAEVFIDYFSYPGRDPHNDKEGNLLYLSNSKLLEKGAWHRNVDGQDAKFYENVMCGRSAFVDSIMVNQMINLKELKSMSSAEERKNQRYDLDTSEQEEYVPELQVSHAFKPQSDGQQNEAKRISLDDLTWAPIRIDENTAPGMQVWKFKYYTNDPLQVIVNKRDKEKGFTQSFTLLFQNSFSFTFSLSENDEKLRLQALADKKAEELKELELQNNKDKKVEDNELTAIIPQQSSEVKKDKKKVVESDEVDQEFGLGLSDKVYRAIYFVPDAQFVVEDKTQDKILVQTCCREESKFSDELINDINGFSVTLYNITDDVVKTNTKTSIPLDTKVRIVVARDGIMSYMMNDYGSKFQRPQLKGVVSPMSFTKMGNYGAFLYTEKVLQQEEQNKIHFFTSSRRSGWGKIEFPMNQTVSIDYPIMAYKGFAPDNREIVMTNLADREHPQKVIHLFDRQLICFVGHGYADREAKIGFLAMNHEDQIDLCWLICTQPFEKKVQNQYEDYEIVETSINFHVPVLKNIAQIKRAEFVRLDVNDDRSGCLFIQTEDQIYFSNNYTGEYKKLVDEGPMATLLMQRGYNSLIYYVESSPTGSDMFIKELCARVVGGDWDVSKSTIYKINEGSFLALELDPENIDETDSIYTNDRSLIEKRDEVKNMLYVLDNYEELHLIVQDTEGPGSRYSVLETKNLSQLKNLTQELSQFKKKPFNSLSVTKRCLTINEVNYNFQNSTDWRLNVSSKEVKEKDLYYVEEDNDSEEQSEQDSDNKRKVYWTVHWIKNIAWTQRQLVSLTIQQQDEKEQWKSQDLFITKLFPGTRRQDLVGRRGRRDMDSINFISDDKYLIKFRSSTLSGQNDYWTVIDKNGQIQSIPNHCKNYLTWSSQAAGISRHLDSGCLIMLRGGEKTVLSLNTDVTYEENQVTMIEFDRKGHAMQVQNYTRHRYEESLRAALEEDLMMNRQSMVTEGKTRMTENEVKKATQDIQYSDEIFCSKDGDLYRLATVVLNKFDDQVAVNPNNPEENQNNQNRDELLIGMYVVRPSDIQSENSCLKKRQKELKILILLCKTQSDRQAVKDAGFVICGDFMCWQYPKSQSVNLLNLNEMNRLKMTNAHEIDEMGEKLQDDVQDMAEQVLMDIRMKQESDLLIPARQRRTFMKQSFSINKISIDEEKNTGMLQSFKQKVRPKLFDTVEQKEIVMQGPILWRKRVTRTIDLSMMMENENSSHNTKLYDVPNSSQLSMERIKMKKGIKSKDLPPVINYNLLQVIVENKAIVFDLEEQEPKEIFFFKATNQFMAHDKYVESGILMGYNHEDPSKKKDGFLMNTIVSNREKSAYFHRQERMIFDKNVDYDSLIKTPICHNMFRGFAEVDLVELQRIQSILENNRKLDKIDMQTVVSLFDGHTIFSIFNEEERLHQQIYSQIDEGEWPDEEQEDESEVQNNVLRRLYRILTIPTPDMVGIPFQNLLLTPRNAQTQNQNGPVSNQLALNEGPRSNVVHPIITTQLQMTTELDILNSARIDESFKNQEGSTEDDSAKKQGLYSVLQKSLYIESQRIRDYLMQIANVCQECQISNFAKNQQDMSKMLSNMTGAFLELVIESFVKTTFTEKITTVKWYPEATIVTLRRSSSMLTEAQCEELLVKKFEKEYGINDKNLSKTQVEVQLLNIDWLLADKNNFVNFVSILVKNKNDKIYQTELVNTLLEEFWDANFFAILSRCMLPWVCYALCCMYFFMTVLQDGFVGYTEMEDMLYEYVLSALVYITLFYQVYIEIIQSKGTPFLDYVRNYTNWIDFYTYFVSAYIVTVSLMRLNYPELRIQRLFAAFDIFLLWLKVFDWFKLFKKTSFFMRLIRETLIDILYFLIIFVTMLLTFGCTLFMLQLNVEEDKEDVIAPTFGHFIIDSGYNQYMLSLGEFAMDGFDDHPQKFLVYVLFLSSTFFTQITFLNMLIAIMSDTFERVIENKSNYGLQTKLEIMGDYSAVIIPRRSQVKQDKENFLFVIKPSMDGEDQGESAWEGGLGLIKASVEKGVANLKNFVNKEILKINNQNLEAKARDSGLDKEVRNQYQRISQRFKDLEEKTSESNRKFQDNIAADLRYNRNESSNKIDNFIHQQSSMQEIQNEMNNNIGDLVKTAKANKLAQNSQSLEQPRDTQTNLETQSNYGQSMATEADMNNMNNMINQLSNRLSSVVKKKKSDKTEKRESKTKIADLIGGSSNMASKDVQGLKERSNELTTKVASMQSQMNSAIQCVRQLKLQLDQFDNSFNQNMNVIGQHVEGEEDNEASVIRTGRVPAGQSNFVNRSELEEMMNQIKEGLREFMVEQQRQSR